MLHPPTLLYTSHPRWPLPQSNVAVLDASFNPPTNAHLALALAHPNAATPTAHLLLLSVRNADKALKPTDATHAQRIDMILCLAHALEERLSGERNSTAKANVAVAIIDEPTFVRKSAVLRAFLQSRVAALNSESDSESKLFSSTDLNPSAGLGPNSDAASPQVQLTLTFQMGTDTLVRLLDPKYYGPPPPPAHSPDSHSHSADSAQTANDEAKAKSKEESQAAMHAALGTLFAAPPAGDGSRVLCARRASDSANGGGGGGTANEDEGAGAGAEESPATLDAPAPAQSTETNSDLDTHLPTLPSCSLPPGSITFVSLPPSAAGLSSSAVRAAVAADADADSNSAGWEEMVPAGVAAYIQSAGLYRSPS